MYAFPNQHNPQTGRQETGMLLRDYFAAKGLSMIGNFPKNITLNNSDDPEFDAYINKAAELAYKFADAMMKVRGEL